MTRHAIVLPVLALLLVTAACRGSGTSSGSNGAAGSGAAGSLDGAPSTSATRDGRAWAACMREHGIDVPDPDPVTGRLPGFDKGAQDRVKFQAASAACAALEAAAPGGVDGRSPLTAEEMEQARGWTACMREHGVNVPDPDPNQPSGPHFERIPNLSTATLDAANQACWDKRLARWGDGN
jgi:hypothetical protein